MLVYVLMIGATSTIAIGTVMQVLFGLPFWVSILVGGVVVLYSTIGGMWSLTLTDIVQFLIMTVGLVFLLMPMSIVDAGGWDAMVAALPASFDFTAIGWDTILTYPLIYFFGIFIGQDIWQRVFTKLGSEGVAMAGTAAGLYCVLYGLAGALIGMAAKVLLPDLENVNNAFASIVQTSLPNDRGLVIAAALAALMSTAAAGLLAASTTVVQDLLPRLRQGRESGSGDVHENRIATLLMGVVVLVIALVVSDVISALTLAYNLLVGGMLIPLIGAIYWKKRATTAGAISSMSLGFLTALFFMLKDGLDANTPIYYSLSVALVSFVLVSLLSPRPSVVAKVV